MSTPPISQPSHAPLSEHLPLEIIQYVVSFVDDRTTLNAVSLTTHSLVPSAQAKIFSRVHFTDIKNHIQHFVSSPHISRYIHSIVAGVVDGDLPVLLDFLSDLRRASSVPSGGLKELTFTSLYSDVRWSTTILRSLYNSTLPCLSSLTLEAIEAPFFLVTSCTSLQCLRIYGSILYLEREERFSDLFNIEEDPLERHSIVPSLLESESMPLLTMLALDETRNDDINPSPLVWIFHSMTANVCLDIGYWREWNNYHPQGDNNQGLDLFHLYHFPHLLYFSTRIQWSNLGMEDHELRYRLDWLLDSADLSLHPLKILRLQLGMEYDDIYADNQFESECQLVREALVRLDHGLKESQLLEKLVIPILPKFHIMRGVLKNTLTTLSAAGKLSFDLTNMEDYFSSLNSCNTIS
ncbi:hypothetical protein DL96DRAFT_1751407 [Flagelloscypha sp. PMI_526]|nr:hypothetical protein DL96DRAFT_1751407 [Flagelloscypha sp. PMI_526]